MQDLVYQDNDYDSLLMQYMIRFMGVSSHDRIEPRNYHKMYSRYMPQLRNKPTRMIEIGMYKGLSWLMWGMYLGAESLVYGIDISDQFVKHYNKILQESKSTTYDRWRDYKYQKTNKRSTLKYRIMNSCDWDQVNYHFPLKGYAKKFDVIIDDGSHEAYHQIKTYKNFEPLLKGNGVYFIEDINNIYTPVEPLWEFLEELEDKGHKVYRHMHMKDHYIQDMYRSKTREPSQQWIVAIEHNENSLSK